VSDYGRRIVVDKRRNAVIDTVNEAMRAEGVKAGF
jgi:hypothetical protein